MITLQTYNDFKKVVYNGNRGPVGPVYYYEGNNMLYLYCVWPTGVVFRTEDVSDENGKPPSSFKMDFANAIKLESLMA